ncbi:unnamed protein product, partial [marine sediment metagenome]
MSGKRRYAEKPQEYWWRMGEIGELIASAPFSRLMHQKYGKVLRIENGHAPLYTKSLFPLVNYDEEAMHLDLIAVDVLASLKYKVFGIAEIKSTLSYKKVEFKLKGVSPRFLGLAIRKNIPVYFYVVRFVKALPDDIITDDG